MDTIVNDIPKKPNFIIWYTTYYQHLLNMYSIYLLNNIQEENSENNFKLFSYFIYNNSSKHISIFV